MHGVQMVDTWVKPDLVHHHHHHPRLLRRLLRRLLQRAHRRVHVAGRHDVHELAAGVGHLDRGLDDVRVVRVQDERDDKIDGVCGECGGQRRGGGDVEGDGGGVGGGEGLARQGRRWLLGATMGR